MVSEVHARANIGGTHVKYRVPILVGFLALLLVYAASGLAFPANTVTVSFINVGQGDAILLRDGNGFDVLIDGGRPAAGPTVVAYLRQQAVDSVEVMVATHADSDHIGGLVDVLNMPETPVLSVLYNGYPGSTATWSEFVTAVTAEGITLTAAQYPVSYTWGAMMAYVLNPATGLLNPDQNESSVVLLVTHDNVRFLLTGDIGATTEATVVARGTPVVAEILKVAHHGSKYSSSATFLSAVSPHEAIISVGPNSYGHPAPETITRLLAAGARVWRTDESGTIVVSSDGITYTMPVASPTPTVVYTVYLPVILR